MSEATIERIFVESESKSRYTEESAIKEMLVVSDIDVEFSLKDRSIRGTLNLELYENEIGLKELLEEVFEDFDIPVWHKDNLDYAYKDDNPLWEGDLC